MLTFVYDQRHLTLGRQANATHVMGRPVGRPATSKTMSAPQRLGSDPGTLPVRSTHHTSSEKGNTQPIGKIYKDLNPLLNVTGFMVIPSRGTS